jgi:hypothetical protein
VDACAFRMRTTTTTKGNLMTRVRVNALYQYKPVLIDKSDKPYGVLAGLLQPGDIVRVVNIHGCPKANTMGQCHIERPSDGEFLGMVCVGSLVKAA